MIGILAPGQKLDRASQAYLKSKSWKINAGDGNPADFRADKRLLRFNFECVDESALGYKSVDSIIDLMRAHSRQKSDGIGFVFILNFDLPFVSFDRLIDLEILAVKFEELSIFDELDRFTDSPVTSLSNRHIRMLERSSWACMKIGEYFFRAGDKERALEWAKIAVHPSNPVSGAHQTAFNWFRSVGDIDGARELAEQAHIRKKDNLFFMQALRQLALDARDEEKALMWGAKIKEVNLDRPRSIEDILKLKSPIGNTDKDRDSKGEEAEAKRGWMSKWFGRKG